jgi:hypothetical protein
MAVQEALNALVSFCNRVHLSGYRGWVTVVHGYGSTGMGGGIRQRVRTLVSHHRDALECQFNDAVNPGSTDLRILKPLPERPNGFTALGQQIMDFCRTPKEETRIGNKFHRLPVGELRAVLKELQVSGNLSVVKMNGRKALVAVEGREPVKQTSD